VEKKMHALTKTPLIMTILNSPNIKNIRGRKLSKKIKISMVNNPFSKHTNQRGQET